MKMKSLSGCTVVLGCLLAVFSLGACGGSDRSSVNSGTGHGILALALTDSSSDEYQAVYVTIDRVEVHHEDTGLWETVATPGRTYNLLDLVNGVRTPLGVSLLASGHYTQMRLIIGKTPDEGLNLLGLRHPHANYTIDPGGGIHEMKVPSGTNTGLKIVNGFDISENGTTELLLDFDALRSVVKAGSSGQYLLKPTVKVLRTAGGASVFGTVSTSSAPPDLLGGVLVTAQTFIPTSLNAKDRVVVEAGTLTADTGEYALFLEPGTYNLVAVQGGYLPACAAVTLEGGSTSTVDFSLTAETEPQGTIAGSVSIAGSAIDTYVTLDFRQEATCAGSSTPTTVTVKSLNIANNSDYLVDLPAGDYQVVASTAGGDTQSADVTVVSGQTTVLNILF